MRKEADTIILFTALYETVIEWFQSISIGLHYPQIAEMLLYGVSIMQDNARRSSEARVA